MRRVKLEERHQVPRGGGEEQAVRGGAGGLPGAGGGDAGGEPVGEGVAGGGGAGVDGAALLAALGGFEVKGAADFDDLAVDGDGAGGGVGLGVGEGGELAPAQAGVGGGYGHQLIQLVLLGEGGAEGGDVGVGGDVGLVDEQRRFPGHGDGGAGAGRQAGCQRTGRSRPGAR